jgi:hypothetical protein
MAPAATLDYPDKGICGAQLGRKRADNLGQHAVHLEVGGNPAAGLDQLLEAENSGDAVSHAASPDSGYLRVCGKITNYF